MHELAAEKGAGVCRDIYSEFHLSSFLPPSVPSFGFPGIEFARCRLFCLCATRGESSKLVSATSCLVSFCTAPLAETEAHFRPALASVETRSKCLWLVCCNSANPPHDKTLFACQARIHTNMSATIAERNTAEARDTHEDRQLFQLVYLSSSHGQYSRHDLVDILATSRRNNTRANITGLLLYHDGNIIQFLEGEEATVDAVYDRIARDSRHKGILPLVRRKIDRRDFGSWSMGFKDIEDSEKEQLDGFNDLMGSLSNHTTADPAMSKQVQRLIRSYRQVCGKPDFPCVLN